MPHLASPSKVQQRFHAEDVLKHIYFLTWVALFLYGACLGAKMFPYLNSLRASTISPWAEYVGMILLSTNIVCSAPSTLLSLAGLLFGSPDVQLRRAKEQYLKVGFPENVRLIFCFVSTGKNSLTLKRSIENCLLKTSALKVPCEIEIVLDRAVPEISNCADNIRSIIVPACYQTPQGSMHKARALHYATIQRRSRVPINDQTWILHLDEESLISEECIYGIATFIRERGHDCQIGQGEIQYNHPCQPFSPILRAADSLRTGQDLGLFRAQYRIFNSMLMSLHGSFLLVRWDLENTIGFDQPSSTSITEDAFFGLRAKVLGARFGWISGWINELSPLSIWDLIQQRRRWITGTRNIAVSGLIPSKYMLLIKFQCAAYPISSSCFWLWIICTVAGLTGSIPNLLTVWASCVGGTLWALYAVGGLRSAINSNFSLYYRTIALVSPLVLAPFCLACEAFAILYACISPANGFYLVGKDSLLHGELSKTDSAHPIESLPNQIR
jgi:egghead protein (zeste-white 4 protein)